jgi:hypothetical protein
MCNVRGPTLRDRARQGCYPGRDRHSCTPSGKQQVLSTATRRHLAASTCAHRSAHMLKFHTLLLLKEEEEVVGTDRCKEYRTIDREVET